MAKKPVEIRFNAKTDHWYLSDFAPSLVIVDIEEGGKRKQMWFPNVAVAFNYLKTDNDVFREKILSCTVPSKAQYYGSEKAGCPLRKGWESDQLRVMRLLDWAKFSQNRVLAQWLIATGDAELVEYAPWEKQRPFWSVNSKGEGDNNKGKILMRVRERLIEKAGEEHKTPLIKF